MTELLYCLFVFSHQRFQTDSFHGKRCRQYSRRTVYYSVSNQQKKKKKRCCHHKKRSIKSRLLGSWPKVCQGPSLKIALPRDILIGLVLVTTAPWCLIWSQLCQRWVRGGRVELSKENMVTEGKLQLVGRK